MVQLIATMAVMKLIVVIALHRSSSVTMANVFLDPKDATEKQTVWTIQTNWDVERVMRHSISLAPWCRNASRWRGAVMAHQIASMKVTNANVMWVVPSLSFSAKMAPDVSQGSTGATDSRTAQTEVMKLIAVNVSRVPIPTTTKETRNHVTTLLPPTQ